MTSSTPCFWPFDFKQTLASVTTALFVGRSLEKKQGSSHLKTRGWFGLLVVDGVNTSNLETEVV
jgi:hypothetical protein